MKLAIILIALAMSGCSVFNTKPAWPDAPEVKQCKDLELVPEGTTKLSETLRVVSRNYGKYHECKASVEAWEDWYTRQKKI